MESTLLYIGQTTSIAAKIVVFFILVRAYRRTLRKAAMYWAVAWASALITVIFDMLRSNELLTLAHAIFASMLLLGSLSFLEENSKTGIAYYLPSAGSPLVAWMYSVLLGNTWETSVGIPYGVASFTIVLAGILIMYSNKKFPWTKRTGMFILLFGIHEMDYPFLRNVEWFAPIGFALGAVLTFTSAYSMAKVVTSKEFLDVDSIPFSEVERGIKIVSPDDYNTIVEGLKGYPVLAFLRDNKEIEGWKTYFITNTHGRRTVEPTNLAKIVEISKRYLTETSEGGIVGVVLLNGLEYLLIHNSTKSLAKFLATLRDLVLIHDGQLIVMVEEDAWEPSEYNMLKKILGVID